MDTVLVNYASFLSLDVLEKTKMNIWDHMSEIKLIENIFVVFRFM